MTTYRARWKFIFKKGKDRVTRHIDIASGSAERTAETAEDYIESMETVNWILENRELLEYTESEV